MVPESATKVQTDSLGSGAESGGDGAGGRGQGAAFKEGAREILRTCVCSRTRMLDRLLTRLYDEALRPTGLGVNQLTVLALIASMDGLRAVDVGRYLEMDKSTVSRGLSLLKRRGWVEEVPFPGCPRALALTSDGAGVLTRAMPHWRSAGEEAQELLGRTSIESLQAAAAAFLLRRARR